MLTMLLALSLAAPNPEPLFASNNLVAWCIVPFDAQKRSPEDRAAMLARLGFTQFAYDWRAEHLPTFERELLALKKHNVQLSALWFPGGLSKDNLFLLDVMQKHGVKTQLWLMLNDFPAKDQPGKISQAAAFVKPVAEEAAKRGHTVALYNHGGWGGEPENQVAVIDQLKLKNVGIVYNQHHGHAHISRFKKLLELMKPHLLTLNLNGMTPDGDRLGQKILPLSHGQVDAEMLKVIRESGYTGPIGILGHTGDDAEARLADNLDGLKWLLGPTAAKPAPRTPTGMPYLLKRVPGKPFTIEVQALMPNSQKALASCNEEQLQELLRVYRVEAGFNDAKLAEQQQLLGKWERNGNSLQFHAKFPPEAGAIYRAYLNVQRLTSDKAPSLAVLELKIPALKLEPTTRVVQVFPTANELPENTLRMYFEFSAPMSKGGVYQHIKLLNEKNQEVKYPFLELDQELWSPDGTRFTLLFDPGRVKRGLVPREELGPPLEEGKKYTLEIRQSWKDDRGVPLKETFRKSFKVLAPVETGLDIKKEFVPGAVPEAGTRKAYSFKHGPRILDMALAQRYIWIEANNGERVDGTITLGTDQLSWSFKPAKPWQAGEYQVKFDTRLEDICGNRIGEPFEVNEANPPPRVNAKNVGWPFRVSK